MDPDTPNPHAIEVADELQGAAAVPRGSFQWIRPETGTTCVLHPGGVYEVFRAPSNLPRVPLVVGVLGPQTAQEFLTDPLGDRARRAAANVITVVDEQ